MLAFLLSPALSFFSKRLYHKASQSKASFGIGYLFYLSCLFGVLLVALCYLLFLPIAQGFSNWLIDVTPAIQITPMGIVADVKQPYLVKYPAFGTIYMIDTTKSVAELEADSSKAFMRIGKKNVLFFDQIGSFRVISLENLIERARLEKRTIQITRSMMRLFTERLFQTAFPILIIFLSLLFFFWKLSIALFYSLVAVVLNLFRKEKLPYKSLFILSCFAITPATIFEVTNFAVPGLYFNLNTILVFGLTTAYLAYGIFIAAEAKDLG